MTVMIMLFNLFILLIIKNAILMGMASRLYFYIPPLSFVANNNNCKHDWRYNILLYHVDKVSEKIV